MIGQNFFRDGIALGALVIAQLLVSAPVSAQSTAPVAAAVTNDPEEIIVTGSRIRRDPLD